MSSPLATSPSRLLAYLQLMRLPNVFTAMADIAMGFLVTHESLEPIGVFVLLILSSSCLYIAGMVTNDVCDLEVDRVERPYRPLPSGRVPLKIAPLLGFSLLIAGVLAGIAVAIIVRDIRPAAVAAALSATIFSYNAALKSTLVGPIAMGGCRFLNALLGMSASATPWTAVHWTIAAGIGIYIAGVTWFARSEATTSKRPQLAAALLVMLAGMAILWCYPHITPQHRPLLALQMQRNHWALLWAMLALIIGWRALRAVLQPSPTHVQAAVKTGILSMIVLNAAVVFAIHGPVASIAIMSLLIPTFILGWWVYST
jgi:4-hydroxybenzoate polyprenyltransferase